MLVGCPMNVGEFWGGMGEPDYETMRCMVTRHMWLETGVMVSPESNEGKDIAASSPELGYHLARLEWLAEITGDSSCF